MSGLHEVDCSGCGRRHVTSGEQARKERVLRCDCGHFVRLDRAVAERRSEPAPPPVELVRASADEEEDDATHMLSSMAAVAAISGRGRGRSPQPSLVDDERVSRPVSRPSTLRSLAPAPARQPSIAPSDKPLWYVDLGGTELVQMTIEQLILARRGGKLGEGALVWREGMPSWRPVGTLIPAASASAHPSPLPSASASATPTPSRPPVATATPAPAPTRPPPPKRTPPPSPTADDATPQSLASYERPLATLEFAFEKPEPARAPARSSFPSLDSSAAQLSRPPTPLPRASLSAFSTPFPRPAQLPLIGSLATPFPAPRLSPPPAAPAATHAPTSPQALSPSATPPAPPVVRTSDRPGPQALSSLEFEGSLSERPRWVSACIALVVCVTASAAGASLVRNWKQQKKPQALALPVSTVTAPVLAPATASQPQAIELLHPAASSAPRVVDLESLSVERKRTLPRAQRAAPKPAPAEPTEGDSSDETATPANEAVPESAAPETPKGSDLPPAARANPYGSGSLIDQIKRATADEEAGQ
ncbi:MAG TPA: DUF4339 domain-containing protein [Polyangiaceae bacterium]|nr:DUF4339 domain-containing protein [Polyangiaceae bacterium]